MQQALCVCMGMLAHDMLVPANLIESQSNADSVQGLQLCKGAEPSGV